MKLELSGREITSEASESVDVRPLNQLRSSDLLELLAAVSAVLAEAGFQGIIVQTALPLNADTTLNITFAMESPNP